MYMERARVAELVRYPVKGCAGQRLDEAAVTSMGLTDDRLFMLVDDEGTFLSQRRITGLAVVRPRIVDDGRRLALSAPGVENLLLDVAVEGRRLTVTLFKWAGKAVDQGDEVADWFSTVLGRTCRLVRVPPEHDRASGGETKGRVGFADATAFLVTSLSSLDRLNGVILERGGQPVPMNRFRPNLVLAGWSRPHTEDDLRTFLVGDVELGYSRVAVRCPVPMVDQETGERAGPEPIRSLATYRRHPDGGVTFGIRAAVLSPGSISVGDDVTVHTWAAGTPS